MNQRLLDDLNERGKGSFECLFDRDLHQISCYTQNIRFNFSLILFIGNTFLIHTKLDGVLVLRLAVGGIEATHVSIYTNLSLIPTLWYSSQPAMRFFPSLFFVGITNGRLE